MKIGELRKEDRLTNAEVLANEPNPYATDPVRHGDLRIINHTPCNAETNRDALSTYITPNDDFYVRNHGPVPVCVEGSPWRVSVAGDAYDGNDIPGPKESVTVTIQCGGNRRGHFRKKANGTQWGYGAISTATFEGVPLRTLLEGKVKPGHNWVTVEGDDGTKCSVPLHKVMDPDGGVMLATAMNGERLPRDHGYPVRLVVPGYVGVRQVKWVRKVTLEEKEVSNA